MQAKSPASSPLSRALIIVGVLVLGTVLRMEASSLGGNYDLESYRIVADIMAAGGNVYRDTPRYNYGPVWFNVLHFLDVLPFWGGASIEAFHAKVAAFLTLVDIGLFVVLVRSWSLGAGVLFFLNPISIIITGYHSQFENLAILVAFCAVLAGERIKGRAGKSALLVGIGLSLVVKHLLFVFPLWLAMREKSWSGKVIVVAVPYLIFLAGFAFYWPEGREGIIAHVFRYASSNNAPFWTWAAPGVLLAFFSPLLLFVSALLAVGLFTQDRPPIESLRLYFIALVVFSSAIANQYIAIPVASISASWNWAYAAYSIFGTWFLSINYDGLHLEWVANALHWGGNYGYEMLACFLAIGLAIDLLPRERLLAAWALASKAGTCLWTKAKEQLTAPLR
jgi:hypothetical protein